MDKVPDPCTTEGTFSLFGFISWSSVCIVYSVQCFTIQTSVVVIGIEPIFS